MKSWEMGRTLWIIEFKDGSKSRYYSTLTALCADPNNKDIGASKSKLQKMDFDTIEEYSNEKCTIKKSVMRTTSQTLKFQIT